MKKIAFLSGTRADFGKLKSLIQAVQKGAEFEYGIFATGMHLQEKYGMTVIEIEKAGFTNIHRFENHTSETTMDLTLAKTIEGFSAYVKEFQPDLIVVHGDRVEALAGAIVGSLNNILVGHIEGGELSGTVDELIRHSVSKLSHIHFVSNKMAAKRLVQMGELESSIFTIGSADLDVLFSSQLPSLETVKAYYDISFDEYAVVLYHPVTTDLSNTKSYAAHFVATLLQDDTNYIVIYPNNDLGSNEILAEYEKLKNNPRFRIFPSLRFEYFITLLKNAKFLIGNSSAGIHEAPYLGIPTVNIGRRQENRDLHTNTIVHVTNTVAAILEGVDTAKNMQASPKKRKLLQNAAALFLQNLSSQKLWEIDHQKQFRDL
ncbi:UDP-N-acetylglucosamine 2-epimerase [Leeuwenhoekiella aequorea]|uniref:UDP-N-acetylglucosamine 2-epimerase (Hydrolysing) n=1 Tax=Leeuwenhoekiella aequorea TaxID=283736 RepID=A0A4V1KRH3_9FLAO|nr:UDP-N-acetylglucosamine 2-epimerase [Leeuwenhoekiella aequorea]RXG24912.1 UDP-N-acetylglucosamine 2-epimerase (hydrolysing) [Leeuwenhoekiella aequorea]